ncbi:ComF family protein [Simiduia agarivorans]|uniref:Amidophosphoribosyltransferase-like protein n=1 Tax=Simiduia agarivorans (strain DSM 21679 / JCM 13881 / BCRC 17597 / SA1) TaxID=1117647 RepID=K4KJ80_SIMAS|nr:ComF family protein [Simiduia agarivorans]AFU99179.1 amidophosphoribosyltransferase-like protein [Simiduia agarivorans SA1 = DSM 21679]
MKPASLSRCLLCDDASPSGLLCAPCTADLPTNPHACWQCALPLPQTGLCPDCQQHPPAFSRALAAFEYRAPLTALIARWKHQADQRPLHLMARALLDQLAIHYQQDDWPQALIPVPIHSRRLIGRGFHQTHQLARYIGKALGIPIDMTLLSKRVSGHAQQGLDRKERLRNLRGTFACDGNPTGLHLSLVDDVLTTGATANTLAELLRQRGAARVDVWVLARTP